MLVISFVIYVIKGISFIYYLEIKNSSIISFSYSQFQLPLENTIGKLNKLNWKTERRNTTFVEILTMTFTIKLTFLALSQKNLKRVYMNDCILILITIKLFLLTNLVLKKKAPLQMQFRELFDGMVENTDNKKAAYSVF